MQWLSRAAVKIRNDNASDMPFRANKFCSCDLRGDWDRETNSKISHFGEFAFGNFQNAFSDTTVNRKFARIFIQRFFEEFWNTNYFFLSFELTFFRCWLLTVKLRRKRILSKRLWRLRTIPCPSSPWALAMVSGATQAGVRMSASLSVGFAALLFFHDPSSFPLPRPGFISEGHPHFPIIRVALKWFRAIVRPNLFASGFRARPAEK